MNDNRNSNGQGELPPEKAGIEERTMAMVTAYALDQVTEVERKAVEELLATSPKLRQHVESIRQLGGLLRSSAEEKTEGSPSLRSVLTNKLESASPPPPPPKPAAKPVELASSPANNKNRRWLAWVAGSAVAASVGGYLVGKLDFSPSDLAYSLNLAKTVPNTVAGKVESPTYLESMKNIGAGGKDSSAGVVTETIKVHDKRIMDQPARGRGNGYGKGSGQAERPEEETDNFQPGRSYAAHPNGAMGAPSMQGGMPGYMPQPSIPPTLMGRRPAGAPVMGAGGAVGRPVSQGDGQPAGGATPERSRWKFGWTAEEGEQRAANGYFYHDDVRQHAASEDPVRLYSQAGSFGKHRETFEQDEQSGEQYEAYVENSYFNVKDVPLSTFAIDVDTASYANVRRFLNNNQLPPPSSIRVEELLNYFTYGYPGPTDSRPFAVHLEAAQCPWNGEHRLVRVGLKGKEVHKAERPSSNLVFLIDTSGSMQDEDKLPLLKSALTMLTRELTAKDRVTIVTYAGSAGLVLPPTSGNDKDKIIATLDQLLAGGSTHGSAGITLAYEQAKANFIQEGTNRVILCTDGDLNVGVTSDDALVELIKDRAKTGVYLSVMGFGTGNLKDGKLEKLADHGNGVYAYIDGLKEARKVFVEQMSGSLVTIAKDVKIQLEFNPKQVQAYRLLGYENRVMENKDFRNDKKDAGEIGAGHTVTALYEIVPAGVSLTPPVKLRYQPVVEGRSVTSPASGDTAEDISKELLTVRLRYKNPEATENDPATEFETSLANPGATIREASENFRFASAVAMAGLVLRNSQFRGDSNLDAAIEIASTALGEDPQGWRAEFIDLLRRAKGLQGR